MASRFDGFVAFAVHQQVRGLADNGEDYVHELEYAVEREVVAHRQHTHDMVRLLGDAGVDLAMPDAK